MDLKVLISAPGDQSKEVEAALEAVAQLNTLLNAHGHSISARHWQKNLSTGRSDRAQSVLNEQIVDCNAIVAIIGTRLGTPTGKHESGTVEEIYQFLENNISSDVAYDVHVFFNTKDMGNPLEIDADELARVQKFRSGLNEKGIHFAQFSSTDILRNLIQIGLNTLVGKSKPYIESTNDDPLAEFEELGSDDAIELASDYMQAAAEALNAIGESLTSTNLLLNKHTTNAAKNNTKLDVTKEFIIEAARILDDSRKELAPNVRTMKESFDQSYAHINLAISIIVEDANDTDNEPDFSEMRGAIEGMSDSLDGALQSFLGARDTLANIPRRRKELRRAKKGLLEVYDNILGAIEAVKRDFDTLSMTMEL